MPTIHQGFQDEHPTNTESLFRFLDMADRAKPTQECKRRMLTCCPVRSGDRVLDVGCGLGHELQRLAPLVGSQGKVVGVDKSEQMITEATRRATEHQLPIQYYVNDAHKLNFPDHTFSLCRAERVLRYTKDPQQVLNEMGRVVEPGGSVVVFDFDSEGAILDTPDRSLAYRIQEILDNAVPHSWIGRQLFRMFKKSGLEDIQVVPQVFLPPYPLYKHLVESTLSHAAKDGEISESDLSRWWHDLNQSTDEGRFFVAIVGFIVAGQRP